MHYIKVKNKMYFQSSVLIMEPWKILYNKSTARTVLQWASQGYSWNILKTWMWKAWSPFNEINTALSGPVNMDILVNAPLPISAIQKNYSVKLMNLAFS